MIKIISYRERKFIKKFLIIVFAHLAILCIGGETKAQILGQSLVTQDGPYFENYLGLDGSRWYESGMFHHGSSVNGSTGYYLWTDNWIQKKQPNGTYAYVHFDGNYASYFNASAANPNLTKYSASDQDVFDAYGNGRYRIGITISLYNPLTHWKMSLNTVYQTFDVNK